MKAEVTGMKKGCDKGYVVVEAALILPVLVLSLLVIAFLIRVASVEENIMHIMTDESRLSMMRGYFVEKDVGLPFRVEKRACEEKTVSYSRVRNYWFAHADASDDGLISFDNKTVCRIDLPIFNTKEVELDNRLMCRAFIGGSPISGPMSFDDMEREGDGEQVWIFPLFGLRYHAKDCRYLVPKPTEMSVSMAVRRGLRPCKLCRAKNLKQGDLCFSFLDYGDAYHNRDCNTLVKRAIPLDREDATKRGYTPCIKCEGGG